MSYREFIPQIGYLYTVKTATRILLYILKTIRKTIRNSLAREGKEFNLCDLNTILKQGNIGNHW